MDFVHLHLHSEYSLLDGLGKPKKIFEKVKTLNQKALAITDHGNMDCYVKAIEASKETGIKYIPGCEVYIPLDYEKMLKRKKNEEKVPRYHATLWAKNIDGVQTIFRLLNFAFKKFGKGRPNLEIIDFEKEKKSLKKNVIIGTGCASGLMGCKNKFLQSILDNFEDIYVEVMPHKMEGQIEINKIGHGFAKANGFPIIATCDSHYIEKDHAYYQEVLLAIQSKTTWDNPKRWRFSIDDLYLKSSNEVFNSFKNQCQFKEKQINEWMNNTLSISEKSNCKFKPIPVVLPKIIDTKQSVDDLLIEHTANGYNYLSNIRRNMLDGKYIVRLEEELALIIKLGFSEYFLLVEDLIQWAKSQDILVGPGRGSVGGSLVAFCLGITAVDPLEYNLLFARFISPARIDLPDIDMDFEDSRRWEIKEYLKKKYGENKVAAVSTYLEMHGRGALRDVARVFKVPLLEVDNAAKSIVVRSGGDVRTDFTIEDAFNTFEEGKTFYNKYPEVSKTAMALEGSIKATGIHAAGVVISINDFNSGIHGYLRKGRNEDIAINWDKEETEYMGLMKLDVLGLNALTILSNAKRLIKERYKKDIDFYHMKFEDKKVFGEFDKGNTVGIFQYNSYGIQKLCTEVGIESFKDLVDVNALFRPGPLRSGICANYTRRKRGIQDVSYIHPWVKGITGDTYGLIIYQEQIMRLLYELGGLQWRTVDTIRKVVSKSKGEEQFLKYKQQFIDGCKERKTLNEKDADSVFEELKFFGSYSFNLSHSVEYSAIAYWMMCLKVYYPAEFFESLLTWGSAEYKLQTYIEELKRLGFNIHPVDIDKSKTKHWTIMEKEVYPPICILKGIGEKATESIEEWKNKIKEITIKGFVQTDEELNRRAVNSKVREVLFGSGAFGKFNGRFKEIDYNLYPYSWETKKDMEKLSNWFKDSLDIKDIGTNVKEKSWYFAQITETKFGYHAKVKQQADFRDSLKNILGTSSDLGGVYGYARDINGGYQMITFKGELYNKKKYAIEHSAGKWALFRGNSISFSQNIIVDEAIFEDEIMECKFEGISLPLYSEVNDTPPDVTKCIKCHLREECSKPVLSEYRTNVVILGEAPGKDEDKSGLNFYGAAGRKLWGSMKKFGLGRDNFSILNTAKCWPSKTKTPKEQHIDACKEWIKQDFSMLKPILVLSLGKTATTAMLGSDVKISEISGKCFWSREYLCWVVPCIHPSALLHGSFSDKDLDDGIKAFSDKLDIFASGGNDGN